MENELIIAAAPRSKLALAASYLPWWGKIAAKVVMARLPMSYEVWRKIGLFSLGGADNEDYVRRVFEEHSTRSGVAGMEPGFVCLELGPGDGLYACALGRKAGAERCYMVDSGFNARADGEGLWEFWRRIQGPDLADKAEIDTRDFRSVLDRLGAIYLIDGLNSLREIPDASVDWIWSHATLEHVRQAEFRPMMVELRRILKPTGIASHQVDLQDHLAGSLNNLRFSERVWESRWMSSSGFYTNRIRYSEMCEIFRDTGFIVEVVGVERWKKPPIARRYLDPKFRNLDDDELRVRVFDVVLRPA